MGLNKSRGAMYSWTDFTLTCLEGACRHVCQYCYVKSLMRYPALAKKYSGEPRIAESDLERNLGSGSVIFVCNMNDLFAENVPAGLIQRVLDHCAKYSNTYLFQSKDPARFSEFVFPENTVLGTTIETNRDYGMSKAPSPYDRYVAFSGKTLHRKMVSIEPIMDFDLDVLVSWINDIAPDFVSIGADSKGHKLPEPSKEKLDALIRELEMVTKVKLKSNLTRLGYRDGCE